MLPFPLRCPSCDHGNPAGANFCNNCGMPVDLEACGYCDAINQRGADRCHKCGRLLAPLHEMQSRQATAAADAMASSSVNETIVDRDDELHLDAYKATIDGRGAGFSEGTEDTVKTDETPAARPRQPVQQDFAAPVARAASEPSREVVAKRRTPGMRAAVMGVMLVALAVPGYIAYQDPAQFREGLDAIAPRSDASSAAVQPTEPPQAIPVDDPTAQPRETAPVLPTPQAADATRESQPLPSLATNEAQSPPPKAAGNSKAPQAGKNVRQTRSSPTGSKQGSSSRKVVRPKASDARTRANSSDARPAESTAHAADSELQP